MSHYFFILFSNVVWLLLWYDNRSYREHCQREAVPDEGEGRDGSDEDEGDHDEHVPDYDGDHAIQAPVCQVARHRGEYAVGDPECLEVEWRTRGPSSNKNTV